MRFVSPETHTIQLADGHWIKIKKELTAGEERAYRTAGFKRVSQRKDNDGNEVDVDWAAMAFARVVSYLVDWSAKGANGKDKPVTPDAIRALAPESFDEIDKAIEQYAEQASDEKKETPSGPGSSTDSSPVPSTPTGPGTTT